MRWSTLISLLYYIQSIYKFWSVWMKMKSLRSTSLMPRSSPRRGSSSFPLVRLKHFEILFAIHSLGFKCQRCLWTSAKMQNKIYDSSDTKSKCVLRLKWSWAWRESTKRERARDMWRREQHTGEGWKQTLQELRMLSRSLYDCQSLNLNVMIKVSQFVRNSQLCHEFTKSPSPSPSL